MSVFDFNPANQSAFGTLETAELSPVLHLDFVYGINSQTGIKTEVNSATVDTNSGRLRLQTGTNSAGKAIFISRKPAKYRAGMGVVARFTAVFESGVADSVQLIGAYNITNNSITDGYGFGYNGVNFGIAHYRAGTANWIYQNEWNGNRVDGAVASAFNWDKTKGIPVMIKYPYLGYGDIFFYVQSPNTGTWVLVHTIKYANTSANTQLSNPSLSFVAYAENAGNTSNITVYSGSVGFFVSGERSFIGNPRWSIDSSKAGISTETNILTLANASIYNGVSNRSLLRLSCLSFASSAAAGTAVVRLKINATLGGSPSFTPINGSTSNGGVTITNGNSAVSYDTAGTTVTGGTYIYSAIVDNPNSTEISALPYDIFLGPGETLTISAASTNASTIGVAVNWTEDI